MRMQKKQFRIGELAKHLDVEKFVIRFWESEFKVKTTRSSGGQRFYEEKDFSLFKRIKKLLYEQGFTIAGAKKQLKQSDKNVDIIASQKTTIQSTDQQNSTIHQQLLNIKQQLITLRDLL